MAETKQLGLWWGQDAFYFIESSGANQIRSFKAILSGECKGGIKGGPFSPVGMSLIALLTETFRQQKTQIGTVNVALPISEIIFRTFVTPWIPANEIKEVIEFEATKYIPFPLNELSYAYHPVTITESGIKRIRVFFVAIKKEALENYTTILEQAGFQVDVIEPMALSLARSFVLKNAIPENQNVAVLNKDGMICKIIILNQGIPQFVREFNLKPGDEDFTAQIVSETRVSLNYFNRQDNQTQVQQLVVIGDSLAEGFGKVLQDETGLTVSTLNPNTILAGANASDVGFIPALGASIVNFSNPAPVFNFSTKKKAPVVKAKTPVEKKPLNLKSVAACAMVCIPLILVSFLLSNGLVDGPQKKVAELKQKLGPFESADVSKLKEKKEKIEAKLKNFKEIRIKSDVALFLGIIPRLLPEGAWLNTLKITYPSAAVQKTSIELTGYVYLDNTKEQFRLVHKILTLFQQDKEFSQYFKNISLETVKVENLQTYTVTSFKIRCQ